MGALTSTGGTERAGDIKYHAANAVPYGWMKANGAAVSRTAYAALFAAIGTTYGAGDGAATFNLPDLRGEFIRGWDDGRGVDSGRVFGSAQLATNVVTQRATTLGYQNLAGDFAEPASDADQQTTQSALAGSRVSSATAVTDGIVKSARVRPRNVALLACIKY